MKERSPSLKGKFFVVAVVPVLLGTGCNNNNQASASLPPSNPAAYPSSLKASPTAEGSIFAANDKPIEKAPAPKFIPFVLRDGESLVKYKVEKGDTLGKIAKTYGTSVGRIKSANELESDKILAGKTYKIPTRKSEAEIAALTENAPSSISSTKPPSPPTFGRTTTTIPSPSGLGSTYVPTEPRTYSPPPTTERPTFAPRTIDYSGPKISSPSRTASSITIPTEESDSGGSGAAFPTPTFGSGSSF